jgi:hypothetical protein
MQPLKFILGEKRRVRLEISSMDVKEFYIRRAVYTLEHNDETEDSGDCIINDHIISALISPTQRGVYCLEFEYDIGDEIFKECVPIRVVECDS